MSAKADFNPFYVFIPIGIGVLWMGALVYMDSTSKPQSQPSSTDLGTGLGRDIHGQGQYQYGGKTRRHRVLKRLRKSRRARL